MISSALIFEQAVARAAKEGGRRRRKPVCSFLSKGTRMEEEGRNYAREYACFLFSRRSRGSIIAIVIGSRAETWEPN